MVTILTEGKHAKEFVVSTVGGLSLDAATLLSGQKVTDGDLMVQDPITLKMHKVAAADYDSDGAVVDFYGIVIGNWDASATGANADITGVPVVERLAEVLEVALGLSSDAGEKAAQIEAMLAKDIKVR